MNRTVLPAAIAFALAGCATTAAMDPSSTWLVGTWLMLDADLEFPTACASGLPIIYGPDGRFDIFEGEGTWRLDGDRLIETTTAVNEAGDPADAQIGRPFESRIVRIGPDEFRKTYAEGAVETFRRCPSDE